MHLVTSKAMLRAIACASFVLLVSACGPADVSPRDLVAGEECEHCRMTVDRPVYAAQLVQSDGIHRVFDHPICMIRYVAGEERRGQGYRGSIVARYVADLRSRDWMPVEEAVYVVHASIPTVMDYGVVATTLSEANALADSTGGEILRHAGLVARFAN